MTIGSAGQENFHGVTDIARKASEETKMVPLDEEMASEDKGGQQRRSD